MMRTPLVIATLSLTIYHAPLVAEEELDALAAEIATDNAAIEAIAPLPEHIRRSILEASLHPELIVKVASLQEASSGAFDGLLADYSQEEQGAIWDLTRFPGLIEKLVEGDIKRKSQIQKIVADYPRSISETALDYGRREYDLLSEIHRLDAETRRQFETLVSQYSEGTRSAYAQLLRRPEILSILEEDLSLTVLLGDAYSKDAEGVAALAADLNLRLASDYAAALGADEEAASYVDDDELQAIAASYRQKYAYDDGGFDGPPAAETDVQISYYGQPYPYWFGYPRWYVSPGIHASLNWYLTPRIHASVGFYPATHYATRHYAPVRHHVRWSKAHHQRHGHQRAKMKTQRHSQSRIQKRSRNRSSRRM